MSIADIKSAYNTYRAAIVATTAAQQDIVDLGAIPKFGDIIATDPEYANIISARNNWRGTISGLRATLNTAKLTQQDDYLTLLNAGFWSNQWVKLTGLSVSPTTAFIGYADSSILKRFLNSDTDILATSLPPIIEITNQPTLNFPNIN